MPPTNDLPTLLLPNLAAWSAWLTTHATTSPGIWLTLAKKGTQDRTSLTPSQALDEALCFGWINGQGRRSLDPGDGTTVQRFTPRRQWSTWSKVNVAHVERLAQEGRMQARGWEEVERAKGDGRWEAAYGGVGDIAVPVDLEKRIEGENAEVRGAWEGLGRGERYKILIGLVGVRTERGRERAVGRIVEGLRSGGIGKKVDGGKKGRAVTVAKEDGETRAPLLRESRAERAERRARRSGNERAGDAL